MSGRIPESDWRWFGNAGHFICARDCRFHLCTLIGDFLVSTVGQYLPDSAVREILAGTRGFALEGKGDYRQADWMKKNGGYDEIGYGRKFETMVFRVTGEACAGGDCDCGLPTIIPTELAFTGYNLAGEAAAGHMRHCTEVGGRGLRAAHRHHGNGGPPLNLTEKVAVALLRHRYTRNMGRAPGMTDEEILATVADEADSYAAVLEDASAVIEVVRNEPVHDAETCRVCVGPAGD